MLTAMATRINQQTNVNIYAGRFLKEDKIGSIGVQAIFTDPIAIGERIGFIKATVSMQWHDLSRLREAGRVTAKLHIHAMR